MGARPRYTDDQARQIAGKAGYSPEEIYPGRVDDEWLVRCVECNQPRRVKMRALAEGRNKCLHGAVEPVKKARPRRKNASAEKRAFMRDRAAGEYARGMSIRAVAEKYGVSFGAVYRCLLEQDVPLRSRGGNNRWGPRARAAGKKSRERAN